MIDNNAIKSGYDLSNIRLVLDQRTPRLDPSMAAQFLAFHPMVRHTLHHEICQKIYRESKGAPPADGDSTLATRGVVDLPKRISGDLAKKLSGLATEMLGMMQQKPGAAASAPDEANTAVEIPNHMASLFIDLLPLIFAPNVERVLESYFRSYFRLDHCTLYRTHPVSVSQGSFLWHRDLAPMGQVHIMLYLTDAGEESGSTEFLDLADTRRMAESGYAFADIDHRLDDLGPLLKPGDPPLDIIRPRPAAGGGIMFAASRCLHRGRVPKRAFRDVFLLVLLPSTIPWRTDAEDFGVTLVSADRQTYLTNPFARHNPTVDEDSRPTPGWAQLGQFGP
jgi:hypothetical protein